MCSYNVSEKGGTVAVTIKRTGNLNQYAIVLCRTEQGSATSTSTTGSQPGKHDYVEHAGQVQSDFYLFHYIFLGIYGTDFLIFLSLDSTIKFYVLGRFLKHQICCLRYKYIVYK